MENYIFPIKIVSEMVDESFDLEKLKNDIQEYRLENPPVLRSCKGGWQSKIFTPDDPMPVPNCIPDKLYSAIETYKTNTRLGEYDLDLQIESYWFNVNPPEAYNTLHVHPANILSAIFWVSCPRNCGSFMVRHPHEMVNFYLGPDEMKMSPNDGALLLFPSYLPHFVESNKSSEDRISISFNFGVK